jgi:hypothetical protein
MNYRWQSLQHWYWISIFLKACPSLWWTAIQFLHFCFDFGTGYASHFLLNLQGMLHISDLTKLILCLLYAINSESNPVINAIICSSTCYLCRYLYEIQQGTKEVLLKLSEEVRKLFRPVFRKNLYNLVFVTQGSKLTPVPVVIPKWSKQTFMIQKNFDKSCLILF